MPYDLFAHKHNFAVWAAGRAAQRGLKNGTVSNCQQALEESGVKQFVSRFYQEINPNHIDSKTFDKLHQEWCLKIMERFTREEIRNAKYGRAAKLIAIYLKAMVINNEATANSSLGKCIHPPIDSRLLKSMAKNHKESAKEYRKLWKSTNWTDLDKTEYYELIETLRLNLSAEEPFWMLERYWTAA